jgi:hypothetical protein
MFEKLERRHGTLLTVRALSVVSATREGITAKNVEDIFFFSVGGVKVFYFERLKISFRATMPC